jgi:DNA-binding Lrp family transcriptional regulator
LTFDRALIAATQGGLPLVPRPYDAVGATAGRERRAGARAPGQMLDTGLIRRIGAVPNHYRLGFTANGMSVWDVDDAQVDALASASASCPA